MKFRLPAGCFAALMLISSLPVRADEPALSGTSCGLDWTISDHVLTVTGSGNLPSPDTAAEPPAWSTFAGDISTIVLGEGITGADAYALSGYPALQSLTLPSTFTSLAPYALADDVNLTEINGLDSVTDFNFHCLSGTAYIAEHPYIITDGKLYYAECTGSTELTVPDGVTEIMPFAFGNLTGREFLRTDDKEHDAAAVTVQLPDSVEVIGDSAFAFCAGLRSIRLPEGLRGIGRYAFFDCAHLESMTLGEHVESVGERAFYNCRTMEILTVNSRDTVLGADAYGTCCDWQAAVRSRGSDYEAMLYELRQHPCRLDEEMAEFAVHFMGTVPYSRIVYTDLSDFTCKQGRIAGWRESDAHTFAKNAPVRFETFDPLRGDVDLDGNINILDVIALNKYLLGVTELKSAARYAADYDADSAVEAEDSLAILRRVLGIGEETS